MLVCRFSLFEILGGLYSRIALANYIGLGRVPLHVPGGEGVGGARAGIGSGFRGSSLVEVSRLIRADGI